MNFRIGIIGSSKIVENLVTHLLENKDYIKFKLLLSPKITFYYSGIDYLINEKGLSPSEIYNSITNSMNLSNEEVTFKGELENIPLRIKESKADIVILFLPKLLKKLNFKYHKHLLENGINIITTNKEGLVENIDELEDIAKFNTTFFSFIPSLNIITPIANIFEGISNSFEIHGFEGILNRFSNIIISEMIKNRSSVIDEFEFFKGLFPEHIELIEEDLNGYDTACTAFLLAKKYMSKNIKFEDIKIIGIKNLKFENIKEVIESGNTVKFLGKASYENEILKIRITPSIISRDHLFYDINDMSEAINIFSDFPTNTFLLSKGSDDINRDISMQIFRELIKFASIKFKRSI